MILSFSLALYEPTTLSLFDFKTPAVAKWRPRGDPGADGRQRIFTACAFTSRRKSLI